MINNRRRYLRNLKFIIENNYNIKIKKVEKSDESSIGNVFIIFAQDNKKYIIKIYNNIKHVNNMINTHIWLYNNRNISSKSNTDKT